MKKQSDTMTLGEADAWYRRNADTIGQHDPVTPLIEELDIQVKMAVEIGCSTGWRLRKLRELYGCDVYGIEPSLAAIRIARRSGISCSRLTAEHLPYVLTGKADLLIYGFCLYLVDPTDWFRIATEGDRVLAAGGHLVIHDFYAGNSAYAVPYEHADGMLSYHFDFSKLWLGNPLYSVARRQIVGDDMVTILKKSAESIQVET